MRAIVQLAYGSPDVLQLREVDKPVVNDDDVLVRVRASSVNALEWHLLTGLPYLVRPQAGLRKPKRMTLGADVAGQVEAVGKNVTRLQPGDEVFGDIGGGAYAEYVCAPEAKLVLKPAVLTFEQAAAVPVAALTALQGLRDIGQIQSGQKVLINGASGGVGTFAVQIAKSFGADVTAVCSTRNVDMVQSIGADHVIDYTQEDFTQSGQRHDLMFDVPGNRPWADCKRVLSRDGIYVMVGGPKGRWLGPLPHLLRVKVASLFGNQRMGWFVAQMKEEDLSFLAELLESGEVVPVIERTYPLEETAAALRYLGEGHAQGKNVITV
ncbi:MAG: NAD(P)-dependent alcohol dehydrogenase [Actinobacteria bacterium]|nr:NAD(P)-dependent alcohol dehydrogenase [Actinomycetota bacterium]